MRNNYNTTGFKTKNNHIFYTEKPVFARFETSIDSLRQGADLDRNDGPISSE